MGDFQLRGQVWLLYQSFIHFPAPLSLLYNSSSLLMSLFSVHKPSTSETYIWFYYDEHVPLLAFKFLVIFIPWNLMLSFLDHFKATLALSSHGDNYDTIEHLFAAKCKLSICRRGHPWFKIFRDQIFACPIVILLMHSMLWGWISFFITLAT